MTKKTKKTPDIDTIVIILGTIGILLTAAMENTWTLLLTMGCYGYLAGKQIGGKKQ